MLQLLFGLHFILISSSKKNVLHSHMDEKEDEVSEFVVEGFTGKKT
jgi:hypothetical protein